MARELTARQNKFIDGVVSGLSYAEAYRQAGYSIDKYTNEKIAIKACELAAQGNIKGIIGQRKKELADKAIWDREQALKMLAELAKTAQKHVVYKKKADDDTEIEYFDPATANSMAKAIEQANKMCGYNEPEKVEISGDTFEVNIKVIE